MFKKIGTLAVAGTLFATAYTTQAGAFGFHNEAYSDAASQNPAIVQVHSKRCRLVDEDGYRYIGHCPHRYKSSNRYDHAYENDRSYKYQRSNVHYKKRKSRGERAAIGGLVGAGIGAIIGGAKGGKRGAGIGALSGGALGAAIGAASKRKQRCYGYDEYGRRYVTHCR
ncbi:MAG: glycine zipper domain-containing protein [Pseudomonadota bacterium]